MLCYTLEVHILVLKRQLNMAHGSYAKGSPSREPEKSNATVPPRATTIRQLPEEEQEGTGERPLQSTLSKALQIVKPAEKLKMPYHESRMGSSRNFAVRVIAEYE